MDCNGIALSLALVLLFGILIGGFAVIVAGWRYIHQDPDGVGGWNSRLEQLGSRHPSNPPSITAKLP